jgi:hypothetical protein
MEKNKLINNAKPKKMNKETARKIELDRLKKMYDITAEPISPSTYYKNKQTFNHKEEYIRINRQEKFSEWRKWK